MHPFAHFFRDHASRSLPGFAAQQRMAPRLPDGSYRSFTASSDARRNAVMLVLCEHEQKLCMMLTLRSSLLPTHKGQWSFPGGRMERDETIEQTALRETHEEVGVPSSSLHVLGQLSSLYTPPSNSTIYPVVAWWDGKDEIIRNPDEVEIVLDDVHHHKAVHEEWLIQETSMTVPLWKIHTAAPLWGATAIIVSEFMHLFCEWQDMIQSTR